MARYFEFRDKYKEVINICSHCGHVEEAKLYQDECKNCLSIGTLFFDSPEKFQRYCQLYKPTGLKVVGEHLQYIVDEALGLV